jgi:predicted deacylase
MKLLSRAIAGQQPGPHLLITGGVHGDEFEPMAAIRQLMARPELADLRGRLTLVPVVNEAAFARGNRVAGDGLDLARTCPGRAGGSITEQVAQALSELIRSADYYIDLHTGGAALSVWPLTGYMLHANPAVLDKQRAMARAFNLPVIWGTDPSLDGRSMSVARDANVPAIYAEYEGGGRCSPAGVKAYVQGCLNVMSSLGMLYVPAAPTAVQFVVEDSRPNSGHMQRCYPAPVDGCFESAVELGQPIDAGQPLGAIVDPLGDNRHEVLAAQTGRILVLRTLSSVRKGDSLAVILELPLTFHTASYSHLRSRTRNGAKT